MKSAGGMAALAPANPPSVGSISTTGAAGLAPCREGRIDDGSPQQIVGG